MKKFLILFTALAVSSTTADFNLNEMCNGILFATLPHPTDSNLFIGCIQGKGSVLGCSHEDEIFDSYLVECVKNNISTHPPHERLCEEAVSGWFPHEEDCGLYIVCQFSEPEVRECPEKRIFNIYLPGCVPGDRDTCEMSYHTTPPPPATESTVLTTSTRIKTTTETVSTTTEHRTTQTTTQTTTRNPDEVVINFVCPIEGFGNIPHPTDCRRYFECYQGIRYPATCPDDYIFDVITSKCGHPESSFCASNIRCQ